MRVARFYLFDLDGTLVNSSPAHERAYREVLSEQHPELLPGFDYRAISGLTTLDAFRSLGLDEAQSPKCTELKQARYRAAVANGAVQAMPGADALLEKLTAHGATIAVVTSASRGSAARTLEATGLMPHVTVLVTADDVSRGKPAPDPYRAALTQLKADAADAMAVEDALSGIASAHAANLKVIGIHDPSVRAQADIYFGDFAALAGVLT